ncbi:MAG: hypothetical protein AB7S71_23720 [Dongiaceae bacterium]
MTRSCRRGLRQTVGIGVATAALLAGCAPEPPGDGAAYFAVEMGRPEDGFVIKLTDPAKIAAARAMVAGAGTSGAHVMGTVVSRAESYNAPWQFHLDPASIDFFAFAIEVCDAATSYVDQHLPEVGGAFLPNRQWCPWSSRVAREVSVP